MYTDLGIQTLTLVKQTYPELIDFYNPQMGNFNFTKEEFRDNIELILDWLKEEEDYFILYQEDYYWLTNFMD